MKPRSVTLFVLLFLLFGCSKREITGPPQPSPTITTSEYVVLSALMDSVLGRRLTSPLVLDDSTDAGMLSGPADSALTLRLQYVSGHLTSLKTETMLDFKAKNLSHTYIDDPKSIHPACVRSSETDARLPWCQVSRVGFSPDGEQALVYAGIVWAPLAGAGSYYVLSRVHGAWVITGSVMIWIS